MNKRFLSTLLTGVMLLAATSMFVSCKDYDDDIKNLQSQIDKAALQSSVDALRTELTTQLTSAQASLQSAINAKADASDLAKLAERVAALETKLATLDDYAKKADVESLATAIAVLTGDLTELEKAYKAADQSLSDELAAEKAARQAVEANLKLQSDALEALKAEVAKLTTAVGDNKTAIEKLQKAVEEIQAKLNDFALKTDVDALKQQMNDLSKLIDANAADINVLSVLVNKRLTSLVFDPQFYWGGIEAMEAPVLYYKALTLSKYDNAKPYDASARQSANAPIKASIDAKTKYTLNSLPVYAQYYMNPSSASIDYITGVSVVSDDKEYIPFTRGNDAYAAPEVVAYGAKNGILTAKIKLDWEKLAGGDFFAAMLTGDEDAWENYWSDFSYVTVMAVQATVKGEKNDTTVTSDFAAIAPSIVSALKITDNDPVRYYSPSSEAYNQDVPEFGWCYLGYLTKTKRSHVFIDMENAIQADYTHELIWDDEDGIDLDQIVEVHGSRNLPMSNQNEYRSDFLLEDLKEQYGLELKYSLVEWTSGDNKTEETLKHATLNGSILKASGINGEQTKASIGREPLVMIQLIDTNNNNAVVAIGYIKFRIVSEKGEDITLDPYTLDAYLTCDGDNIELKWDDIEGDILANNEIAQKGLSKATFEAIYAMDPYNPDRLKALDKVKQDLPGKTYVKDASGNWVVATADYLQKIIWFIPGDGAEHQTNILAAQFTEKQIYEILVKRNKQGQPLMVDGTADTEGNQYTKWDLVDSKTFEVACRLYDLAASGYPDIYVPFQLTVSKLQISLNKIPEYWYAENSAAAKSGFDEIHVNVDVIGQPNADVANFQGDFLSTVFQNTLQLAAKDAEDTAVGKQKGYKAAEGKSISEAIRAEGLNSRLHFISGTTKIKIDGKDVFGTVMTGMSGAKYFVLPDAEDNQELIGYKLNDKGDAVVGDAEILVTIEDTKFVVFDDEDELDNEGPSYVEDLINYASHKDLANTFTAVVGISVTFGECEAPVMLTDSTFNVKFLRPVDVDGSASKQFTDAVDGGNKLDILELIKPIDWRDKWDNMTWVKSGNFQYTTEGNYFKYYNVLSIVPDIDGITTDMGGGTLGQTLLSSVSQQVKVTYETEGATHLVGPKAEPMEGGDFGYLRYDNNNNTVTDFTIRVPLTIGYYWGSTTSYVDIKVKNTLNN